MSYFHPGQRVLCINGRFSPDVWEWTNHVPVEGETYTVSAVIRCPHRLTGEYGGGLRLVEIDTELPGSKDTPRLSWDISRFVPLDIQETATAASTGRGRAKKKVKFAAKRAAKPRRNKPEPALG